MALCVLMPAAWHATSAQDVESLSLPDDVRPDTVYGRVGDWFALRDLDGEALPFSSLSDRTLFVNFWATWCAPCVEEMPTIVELRNTLGDSDVAFLLISIDDSKRAVRRFVKKHKLSLPVYLRDWQPGESTFIAGIVPATFIVNKEGEIAYQHHGAANWDTEPVRRFLQELAQR